MAAILQFEKYSKLEKSVAKFEEGHSAKILLFTGVRFERIDFDAATNRAVAPAQRLAN